MKNLYSIQYSHTAGERHLQTDDITQVAEWIIKASEDEHVIENSIVLTTEIRK